MSSGARGALAARIGAVHPRIEHTVVERFLRYVQYDTQSSDASTSYPSTEKQLVLARVLVSELREIGLADAALDAHGYVIATLPATSRKPVPVVGLIAHLDTSPEVSGAGVKPIVHRNYRGGDIALPGDPRQVIRPADHPELRDQVGHDIITSDGTTLLGADDKAGVAEIIDAVRHLARHREIPHGTIKVAITPDEEVGAGTKFFDVARFGAEVAYTLDGSTAGEVEDETFCADSVTVVFHGVSMHPGFARNRMVNSVKAAADMVAHLPRDGTSPETTEKREGYVHPVSLSGATDRTLLKFIVRDFSVEGLQEKERLLERLAKEAAAGWPGVRLDFRVEESYRNMKFVLDKDSRSVEYALEAVRRTGLQPRRAIIRGGTDGARLSFMGLPTPNLFTGGHAFHSEREWISVQDMEKAVETIVHVVQVWEERTPPVS